MATQKKKKDDKQVTKKTKLAFQKPELKVVKIEVDDSIVEAYAFSTCTTYR